MIYFLNGFSLCWAEIEEDSYLHRVEALKEVESMDFHRPVTFLRERTERENPPFWKPLPLPGD